MKKILITGAGSYIGTSLENYIKQNYADDFEVNTLDMLNPDWSKCDFGQYDTIFHVAGIAHSDNGKISKEKEKLYYAVNTDLTVATATKAKTDGAKQFIFMSSAIVYGESAPLGKQKIITADTKPSPANSYGDSKLQAELGILPLNDNAFKVCVLRPPMIYGKNSRGNYPILSKLAAKLPVFPMVNNSRSMLYIENLCEFVCLMIKNEENGTFHPQNAEYSNTSLLVKQIAQVKGKKVRLVKGFGWALKLTSHFTGLVNKAFGSLCYDMSISNYKENYRKFTLEQSIKETEE